jgi:hypothetical protein
MIYVNVYLEDLVRGGPEEGGWYYTAGELEDSWACETQAQVETASAEFAERYSNEGRPAISSVLSRGRYAIRLENHPGANYPDHRPHYE